MIHKTDLYLIDIFTGYISLNTLGIYFVFYTLKSVTGALGNITYLFVIFHGFNCVL
jgi:ABC-type tungstate transport system substrate-binding protein